MKTIRLVHIGVSTVALLCAACGASKPTTELVTARNMYAQARNGEAAQLNPKGVHEAYKALQAAEKVHADDAGSSQEKHQAYIATRKSELAIAQASEALARKEQERAEETYRATLEQQSERTAEQSSEYAQQLNQTQQELQQNNQQLQEMQAAASQAENELRQMQAMRDEAGRLVISLSGVLFETGKAELSPLAEKRLDTVATALSAYPERQIVIEGHTDAQGNEEKNEELSQQRADAVRSYLEQRGVSPQQLRSVGRGESNPVASNDTPEGRANNRRVEIVIEQAAAMQTPAQQPARSATGRTPAPADSRQNVSGTDTDDDPSTPAKPRPKQQPPQQQPPQAPQ